MAATERVYLVPGILGSNLYLQVAGLPPLDPDALLWVSPFRLGVLGQLRRLEGSLGTNPGPPLDAGGPMEEGYGDQWRRLLRHQVERGYEAVAMGYDWRQGILTIGGTLAARIRADAAAGFTGVRIVAHSMGGLVARAAWRDLASTNQTGLVKRIVTLGTPHLGSYGVCRVFSGDDPSVVTAAQLFASSLPAGGGFFNRPRWEAIYRREMGDLGATWVGMYQLLPNNADVLTRANYPANIFLSTAGFTTHAPLLHNAMNEAASKPPDTVLTMVYSIGHSTPWPLADKAQLGRTDLAFVWGTNGDGQVNAQSAAPAALAGRKYQVQAAHHQLPAATLHHVIDWLYESGPVPPAPVAPPSKLQPSLTVHPPSTIFLPPSVPNIDPINPVWGNLHDC